MATPINKLVVVTPNQGGDTLTAYSTHDRQKNLGRLIRGQVYRAVEEQGGMYHLEAEKVPFPWSSPETWADMDYLKDYTGEPAVIQDDLTTLIYVACKAVVEYVEGK